jgi:hypothetical protein
MSADRAFAVIPSGWPGPRPTATSRPGSASKSSTVAPTSSSSSEPDAPQELLEAGPDESDDAPHFEELDASAEVVVVPEALLASLAPHFEVVSVSVSASVVGLSVDALAASPLVSSEVLCVSLAPQLESVLSVLMV